MLYVWWFLSLTVATTLGYIVGRRFERAYWHDFLSDKPLHCIDPREVDWFRRK
jgi:hypothetical protein